MSFTLPALPYAYDALEPVIDTATMHLHYDKHHQGYCNNFNAAIEGTDLADKSLEEIFANISTQSGAVRNNGGGYYNHIVYWNSMSPNGGGEPKGELAEAINSAFGSLDAFKKEFADAAATRFGSGWAWLIVKDGKLAVTSTANQDNPLMDIADVKGTPILALDVWEHAYYLNYNNRRPEYIENWWKVVNWDYVAEQFAKA
ncbi:superoxide dismutase [Suttonella sp. R2A3]|uniref:superoxide dismutase n=1 Tax=Suttonella sp. R2A3 TaxID=2908648 RepID=UPI001F2084E3|nr:superoxide dismutase [Suttonella sp. R2A3]UJF24508.1 superoxide dismutase [Suttonella sp. R2A3]